MTAALQIEIADHRGAAGDERRGHRRAAHVFVGRARRESPAVVLIRAVRRIRRARRTALLEEIRVPRQVPRARRDDIGLDAAVAGRAAAAERRHLFGVAGAEIVPDRIRGVALGPRRAPGEDRILSALRGTRGVGQRRIAVPMRLAIVLAGADGDHVLRGAGRVDRHVVDDAVGIRIDAGVAGRERHGQIAMRPQERIGVGAVGRIQRRPLPRPTNPNGRARSADRPG